MALTFNFELARQTLFKSGYTQLQVDSINALVDEANKQGIVLKTQLAYILGTAYHECYDPRHPETRLTPMVEFGGSVYLKGKKYYPFYGRGFVQLTWRDNYEKESKRLGLKLLTNPDLVLDVKIAANIAVHGMIKGVFTGKKLSDYITANKTDFPNSRRIINGIDKMALIASYASLFLKCIV